MGTWLAVVNETKKEIFNKFKLTHRGLDQYTDVLMLYLGSCIGDTLRIVTEDDEFMEQHYWSCLDSHGDRIDTSSEYKVVDLDHYIKELEELQKDS